MKNSNKRSVNYLKQVRYSFVFKALAMACNFLAVPVMLGYLGQELYGVWSTLLSIISWVVLFDIGIGNSLKNKIAESISKGNNEDVKIFISTAYISVGVISLCLILFFTGVSPFISWEKVFNTEQVSRMELTKTLSISILFLFTNFWLSLINQIFNGLQRTSLTIMTQFLKNLLVLGFVYFLSLFFEKSLYGVAFVYGAALIFSNILISIVFFLKNTEFIPRLKHFSKKEVKALMLVGVNFFVIQIAVVVLFTSDKILITQLFSPKEVAVYDVVFKLFSIITLINSIIIAPLWPAYSDAYHKKDYLWIKSTIRKQIRNFVFFSLGAIALGVVSNKILTVWLGENIEVGMYLILSMIIFIIITVWNNIFAYFLNAINHLKIQLGTSIVAMFLNIPLSIFFVKYLNMGVYSIILATVISLSFFAILGSIDAFKIIKYEK